MIHSTNMYWGPVTDRIVSFPNSYVEAPTSNVRVCGDRDSREVIHIK